MRVFLQMEKSCPDFRNKSDVLKDVWLDVSLDVARDFARDVARDE